MKNFEKHTFTNTNKHGIVGSFIDDTSIRNDSNVEISFSRLNSQFHTPPHIHTQSKTIVIVLEGAMTFSIDGETIEVQKGEYIVFDKGCVEEVISVRENTENLTLHTPSIFGGDKKEI